MDNTSLPSAREAHVLRWTARIVGLLFIGIFLAFFIPDWLTKGGFPVERDRIPMTIALFMSFVGLLIAWKWEGIGGILAAVSVAAFAILGLQTPTGPGGIILLGVMYLLPAVLFILSWRRSRAQDRAPRQTRTWISTAKSGRHHVEHGSEEVSLTARHDVMDKY